MDNDFSEHIGKKPDTNVDMFGNPMPDFKRKRGDGKRQLPDRFLRGGMEDQPETYSCNESTGGSTNAGEPIADDENETPTVENSKD